MEKTKLKKLLVAAWAVLAAVLCLYPLPAICAPVQTLVPAQENQPRYCLWLFWSSDKAAVLGLEAEVKKGVNFTVAGEDAAKAHPKSSRYSLDCLAVEQLDPVVYELARRLKVGQVSRPFALAKGWAMVMRTTDAFRRQGKALFDQGKHAQAEKAFLRDLELHPRDAAIWHLLALSRAARNDLKGALAAIDQALALKPNSPDLLQDKATMLAYAGRLPQALELYQAAGRSDPDNPTIMSNLAWVMSLMNKDLPQAQKMAAGAVKAKPGNGRFWYTLGLVYQARGNDKDALKAFEQASSLPGAPPDVLKKLAQAKKALAESKPSKKASQPQAPEKTVAAPQPRPEPKPAEAKIAAPEKQKAAPVKANAGAKKDKAAGQAGKEVYLQLATMPDRQTALKELGPLLKAGFKPFVRDWKDSSDKAWLVFYLGPFPDLAEASRLGRELKEQTLVQSYTVRTMSAGFKQRLGRPFEPGPDGEPVAGEEKSSKQEPAAPEVPKSPPARPAPEKAQAAKRAPKAPAESPQAKEENEVYLQVATLPSLELARREAKGLLRAGYRPFVRTWQDRRGRRWEVLYLGPLDSEREARELGRELKSRRLVNSYDVRLLEQDFRSRRGRSLDGEAKLGPHAALEPKAPPAPGPKPEPASKPAPKPEPTAKPEPKAEAAKATLPAPAEDAAVKPRANKPPAAAPLRAAETAHRETYLVVSAHPDRAQAYTSANRFRKAGYRARLSPWPRSDGKVWHRVLVGPYKNQTEAQKAVQELTKRGMIKNYDFLVRDSVSP